MKQSKLLTQRVIDFARQRRALGDTYPEIAKATGYSHKWVIQQCGDVPKGKKPVPPKPRARTKTVVVYRELQSFAKASPELKQRLINLAKRGFDVPPSKQADWELLEAKRVSAEERQRMLQLE